MRTVVIDLETTGKYPSIAEMVQISIVEFDEDLERVSSFHTLCQPNRWSDIDRDAMNYNGIAREDLLKAPTSTEVKESVYEYWSSQLYGELMYAHGWNYKMFDGQFLQLFFGRETYDKMFHYQARDIDDQFAMAIMTGKVTLPYDEISVKLASACKYFDIDHYAHDAYSDCLATLAVMKKLYKLFDL